MTDTCPAIESWWELLRDEVGPHEREALEGHLDGCATCSRRLVDLAGRASLSGDPATPGPGSRTLEALSRLVARPPTVDGRPPSPVGPFEVPELPGLADLELVGRGGMGAVFRGREVGLDRLVAVKVLSTSGRHSPSAWSRATREALLMASLRHPNIVTVHRSGEVSGLPFLVMEWVEGGTLQARIDAGRLSVRDSATTVRDLARAVAEVHALGIIHRDLKPDNVLIAPPSGPGSRFMPKLIDFGIARRDLADGGTEAGAVLGTPGYMAPEQTGLGSNRAEVGPSTDIHGLGAILFACLAGEAPYAGETSWEALIRTAQGKPRPVRDLRPEVPRDLATIVEKCLQPAPSRRYRSAGDLADDLDRFLEGRPISARPVSSPERCAKWARRHPALAASLALLVAASIGAIAGAAYHFASIAGEQVKTKKALASALAMVALGSTTSDLERRMVQNAKALDEGDRALLRRVRADYEGWPEWLCLIPHSEWLTVFASAPLDRSGAASRSRTWASPGLVLLYRRA